MMSQLVSLWSVSENFQMAVFSQNSNPFELTLCEETIFWEYITSMKQTPVLLH